MYFTVVFKWFEASQYEPFNDVNIREGSWRGTVFSKEKANNCWHQEERRGQETIEKAICYFYGHSWGRSGGQSACKEIKIWLQAFEQIRAAARNKNCRKETNGGWNIWGSLTWFDLIITYKIKLTEIKQTLIWNQRWTCSCCTRQLGDGGKVFNLVLNFLTTHCYHCNAKYQCFSKALSIECQKGQLFIF